MLALLSLVPFAASALALPTSASPADEQWPIADLAVQYQSTNTPLFFDSWIDFTITMPGFSTECKTSFPNGALPSNVPCDSPAGQTITYSMTPYSGPGAGDRPETSFTLTVFTTRRLAGTTSPITNGNLNCFEGEQEGELSGGVECSQTSYINIDAQTN